MLDLSNWAHAQLTPCFIAFSEHVFIRPAELGGIQQVFFIKVFKSVKEARKHFGD